MSAGLHSNDVIPLLLEGFPTASARWRQHAQWPGYEPLLHVDTVIFAEHVGELRRHGSTAELRAGFQAVERLVAAGDHHVQGVLSSFLEMLAGEFGSWEEAEVALRPYFGVLTAHEWRELRRRQEVWWKRVSTMIRQRFRAAFGSGSPNHA